MVVCPELPEIDGKMVEYWLREIKYIVSVPMYALREEDQDIKPPETTFISLKHVTIFDYYFSYWVPVDVENPFEYVLDRLHSAYSAYVNQKEE
jgi:hypothetical protein